MSLTVPKVVILNDAVYPEANRDCDSQEGNHIHGQTHSHLGKTSSTKLTKLLRKKKRLRVTE